jgi:hypothetical protein
MTGYNRDQFGPAWTDDNTAALGHNGCDTRNDVLSRDLTQVTFQAGTHDCVVESGMLVDPYSGSAIGFQRGPNSTQVQIDHVVALGDAWQTGAQPWPASQRLGYANDPLVLLAVDGPVNVLKSDSDAASWLPPNRGFRCDYVARQIAIKTKFRLWVTAPERAAMARVLSTCPGQTLPAQGAGPTPTPPAQHTSTATAPPAQTQPAPPPGDSSVYYPNCAAVRAAGKAPLLRGQPGYRPALDRDGDGKACE